MCSGMISSPCSTCVTCCATLDTNIFWHRYSVAYNNGGRKTLEVTSTEPLGTIGSVAYFVSVCSFFVCSLCSLSFFDLWLLITPVVSLNFSSNNFVGGLQDYVSVLLNQFYCLGFVL
jgi:hypothetical protein